MIPNTSKGAEQLDSSPWWECATLLKTVWQYLVSEHIHSSWLNNSTCYYIHTQKNWKQIFKQKHVHRSSWQHHSQQRKGGNTPDTYQRMEDKQVCSILSMGYYSAVNRKEALIPSKRDAETSLVVQRSQCRGPRFNPWSGHLIPHAATKTLCSQINKIITFL